MIDASRPAGVTRAVMDVSYLTLGRGGVSRYILCLLKALAQIGDMEMETISFPISNHDFHQPARALKTLGREFVWQPWVAPRRIRALQADVFHAPFTACVRSPANIPKIATLHDLAYLATPQRFRRWTRIRIPFELKAYRNCARLICPSHATADDAMRLLNIPSRKLVVIPHGSHFGSDTTEQAPAIPTPPEYLLFVSSLETGKNLHLLNETYRLADQQGKPLPPLLIVGKRIEGVQGEGTPHPSWTYLGRIPDEELVWLYRRSRALVYPSMFEGFGFPVLEAMALGTAVVCSPVSSLPEVGGTVPYYAEQTPASYLTAIQTLLNDNIERECRIAEGFQRARNFTWEGCARETADLYRTVASQKSAQA